MHLLRKAPSCFALEDRLARYLVSLEGVAPHNPQLGSQRGAEQGPPVPFHFVRDFVEDHIGRPVDSIFQEIHEEPSAVRPLTLDYAAKLANGAPVTIRVVRVECPESQRDFRDAARLGLLAAGAPNRRVAYRIAAEFAIETSALLAQRRQEQFFAEMEKDAATFSHLWAPRAFPEYGGDRVLVMERRQCFTVEEVNRVLAHSFEVGAASISGQLWRILCSTWLTQAVLGTVAPVEFDGCDIHFTETGRAGFVGGVFVHCRGEQQDWLWKYLLSLARDDPDESCRHLLLQMEGKHVSGAARKQLQSAFRQDTLVLSESVYADQAPLIPIVLGQVRLAAAAGFVALPALVHLCRGLNSIERLLGALPREGDPLRQAIEIVWSIRLGRAIRRTLNPERMGQTGIEYARSILDMPQIFESMFFERAGPHTSTSVPEESHSPRSCGHRIAAALLICLTVTLTILHTAVGPNLAPYRADWISCCIICLCALRLIRD